MMASIEKVRENRIRRMAERQRLYLVKSRRRDPHAVGFGRYLLQDSRGSTPCLKFGYDYDTGAPTATLAEIEAYLLRGAE
jgi:hypothetical protein